MRPACRNSTPEGVDGNLRALRLVARAWMSDSALLRVLAYLAGSPPYAPLVFLTIGLTWAEPCLNRSATE